MTVEKAYERKVSGYFWLNRDLFSLAQRNDGAVCHSSAEFLSTGALA